MGDQEYCGGGPNWWDTAATRSRFDGGSSTSSSFTTTTLANGGGGCGYGWLTDSPMTADINVNSTATATAALDTKMEFVGLGLDWNHHHQQQQQPTLLRRNTEKGENSFRAMLQEGMMGFQHGVFGSQLEHNNQTQFSQSCSSMEETTVGYGSPPPSTILQGFIGSDQINYNHNNNNNYMGLDSQQWDKIPQFLRSSPTHYFNADVRPNLLPVPVFQDKPNKDTSSTTTTGKNKGGSDNNNHNNNKRGRNESGTSSLPPFKVRKEKMGDRITALQQLVSPFGKTDTASVLSEAIEYIKFLHEQVTVLSTPYLKGGAPSYQQVGDKAKMEPDSRGGQDLRSRGLCLVPVSSTFPMTHETTVDFWTPTFGGTFR